MNLTNALLYFMKKENGGNHIMKKTVSMLLIVLMILSLAGCGSLFSTGSSTGNATGNSAGNSAEAKTSEIKISESFTHKDPEGVEYATRYDFCTAPDDPFITESFKEEYGVEMVQQFMIIYADKDDKVICQYDYYVAKDEENAKKAIDLLGGDFKTEGAVCVCYSDAETVEQIMAMNIQYGSLSEATASAYAQSEKDFNAFLDVQ